MDSWANDKDGGLTDFAIICELNLLIMQLGAQPAVKRYCASLWLLFRLNSKSYQHPFNGFTTQTV